MLSECGHNGLGVHNCVVTQDEAGVNCSGRFFQSFPRKIIIEPPQTQNVMRLISDWLMVQKLTLEEWRYVSMECGVQYVMTTGMLEMHKLCADNWVMLEVSYSCQDQTVYYMILFHQHLFQCMDILFYQMHHCTIIWIMFAAQETRIC